MTGSGSPSSTPIDREAIVAIATAPGDGPRTMIRVSGPGVLNGLSNAVAGPAQRLLAERLRGVAPGRLSPVPPATLAGDPRRPRVGAPKSNPIGNADGADLPVVVATAPGPRSFTGEDVVEFQVPGRSTLACRVRDQLVRRLAAAGVPARPAGPGEFSARAFLSGRLSATEALGIALAIEADHGVDLAAATRWQAADGGRRTAAIRARLVALLARLEAGIDFTDEEDVVACTAGECGDACRQTRADLEAMQAIVAAHGGEVDAAARVVLVGPPNAGKSTLFNALLGSPRAVVADIAGTTRDAIEAVVCWPDPAGIGSDTVVTLVDTAGRGVTDDPLAEAAATAGSQAIDDAVVLLSCRACDDTDDDGGGNGEDTTSPVRVDAVEATWTADTGTKTVRPVVLPVKTKGDLHPRMPRTGEHAAGAIVVSARTGDGLDRLRTVVQRAVEMAGRAGRATMTRSLLDRLGHQLDEARRHVEAVADMMAGLDRDGGIPMPELVAATLRAAIDVLSDLDGELDPDRVLDEVFSRFCVGK